MLLQCLGYNQTYVQGAFSLECSLLDALMKLQEGEEQHLLVGGVDEITETSHAILSRFGLYHHGARQGEGAAYFLLSARQQESSYAVLKDVRMMYCPEDEVEIIDQCKSFLENHSMTTKDVDLVLVGQSGDLRYDEMGKRVVQQLWSGNAVGGYKHLCGEYPTSTGFALWLGATILKKQQIPKALGASHSDKIKNVLIYNPYFGKNHSLILLQAC